MTRVAMVQIDIETLSLDRSQAVVLEIGAAAHFPTPDNCGINAPYTSFGVHLDVAEQLGMGRIADWDTMRWWLQQNDNARQVVTNATRVGVADAMQQFTRWFKHVTLHSDAIYVMASVPAFDLGNVRSLLQATNQPVLWHDFDEHSQRTLRHLCPAFAYVNPRLTLHCAEHDAILQNEKLLAIMQSDTHAASYALKHFFKLTK